MLTDCIRWTAICRGAVIHACSMRGLGSFTVDVQSRIARASYGVACGKYFDPDVHLVQDKYWDEQRLEWWAKNQVEWTLKIVSLQILGHIAFRSYLSHLLIINNRQPGRRYDDQGTRHHYFQ